MQSKTDWEKVPVVLNVKDVMKILRISKPTAYKLAQQKGFPATRVGKRVLISRDGLKKWLEEEKIVEINWD